MVEQLSILLASFDDKKNFAFRSFSYIKKNKLYKLATDFWANKSINFLIVKKINIFLV